MRFIERLFGRESSYRRDNNGLNGPARASMVQNLGRVNRQQRVAEALQLRQMTKILGMPPKLDLDDEMIAGGDIRINRGGPAPWLFATVAIVTLAILAWLFFGPKPADKPPGEVKVPGGINWSGGPFTP